MPPKVSVLCRTYNQQDWIEQAVLSALNQTYSDFELIIIDDASTDKTAEKIKKISDPRIRYIRNVCNLGHLENLNLGIRESSGEYICILDGDDEFLPTKLEKQVSFLDANPDYGAVFSYINTIGDKKNYKVVKNCELFEKMINKPTRTKAEMFRECFGTGTFLAFPSEMFRKKFAFYWPPNLLGLCETNFHLSMLSNTNIKVLEEPLVNYRVMEDYTNKWTTSVSLQSELFYILDRFLEIKSIELFKEIFKNELVDIDVPLEEPLLPYILTKIAEKESSKQQWANYNFHRFIKNPDTYKILKEKCHLSYIDFLKIKKGTEKPAIDVSHFTKKIKKYKKLTKLFAVLFLITLICLIYSGFML